MLRKHVDCIADDEMTIGDVYHSMNDNIAKLIRQSVYPRDCAATMKERGTELFKEGKTQTALHCWRRALDCVQSSTRMSQAAADACQNTMHKLLTSLSKSSRSVRCLSFDCVSRCMLLTGQPQEQQYHDSPSIVQFTSKGLHDFVSKSNISA